MTEIDIGDLGYRLVIAQSWFVASELVRRHPSLRLIQTHPGDGTYECLTLCVGSGPKPKPTDPTEQVGSYARHG